MKSKSSIALLGCVAVLGSSYSVPAEAGSAAAVKGARLAAAVQPAARAATEPSSRAYAGIVHPRKSAQEARLNLELFSGPPLVYERVAEIRGDDSITWVGALEDDPHGRVYLTHLGGIAFGEAHAHGRVYEILGIGGSWEVAEIEPAEGVCATGAPTGSPGDDDEPPAFRTLETRSNAPRGLQSAKVLGKGTGLATASADVLASAESARPGSLHPNRRPIVAVADDRQLYLARIDVLGLYTEGARNSAWQSLSADDKAHLEAYLGFVEGGRLVMEARIQNQIDKANDVFAQSGIIVRLGLAHAAEIAKPGHTTDIVQLRNWLGLQVTTPNTPIADLRDAHAADLVSLFDRNTGSDGEYCGIGYTLGPWPVSVAVVNVVDYDCMPDLTFVHEVGHNLGAAHDRYTIDIEYEGSEFDPDDAGLFDYSYGYVHYPDHRTVMSYDLYCEDLDTSCPRIPRFSHPGLPYDGLPTGITGEADNVRTLNRSWYYVSRQRPDQGLPPPPTP